MDCLGTNTAPALIARRISMFSPQYVPGLLPVRIMMRPDSKKAGPIILAFNQQLF